MTMKPELELLPGESLPGCEHLKSRILETRRTNIFIARRRRECCAPGCRFRATTYEVEMNELNHLLRAAGDERRVGQLGNIANFKNTDQ